jgi:hypothetical protein
VPSSQIAAVPYTRTQTPMRPPSAGPCPLCARPATVTDWRPTAPWIVVEGCGCGGFFVEPILVDRLAQLTARTREELSVRVRGFRVMARDAFLTTTDGTPHGRLTVRMERPE